MDSNRFDFLEIGDQSPVDAAQTQSPNTSNPCYTTNSPARRETPWVPGRPAPRDAPERLAEVRLEDASANPYPYYTGFETPVVTPRPKVFKAVEVFGSRGDKAGEFHYPVGLAADKAGVLWVADSYNHRLQRITPDGGVAIVGSRGYGRGQFLSPLDVAVDMERSFYVLENGGHRIQKFNAEGVFQFVSGRLGSGAGEFKSPMSICVSPLSGDIYVADTGNSRVQWFNRQGGYLGSFGGAANGSASILSNPQSIECDSLGQIYVADTFDRRILQFDPTGRLLGYYGGQIGASQKHGSANLNLDEPRALGVAESGKLYIADGQHGAGNLTILDVETGKVEGRIASPGKSLGAFARPCGLTVVPSSTSGVSDNVYIADTLNHRIIRFAWK
jgi:DNA-binding beta-propeller fold protein YncE